MRSGKKLLQFSGLQLVLLTVSTCVSSTILHVENSHHLLTMDEQLINIKHSKGQVKIKWGLTLPEGVKGKNCTEDDYCVDFGVAKVVVREEDHCYRISWTTKNLTELKDCVLLEGHWYGGGEQATQPWPIEKHPRQETAFVTSDMLQKRDLWYGGVSEAYWISSQGIAVRVEEEVPLFLSVPDTNNDTVADELCFSSRQEWPFSAPEDSTLTLNYYVCTATNVKEVNGLKALQSQWTEDLRVKFSHRDLFILNKSRNNSTPEEFDLLAYIVHLASHPKFFSKPTGMPDHEMLKDPIWSTWAEYHKSVNDSRVLEFAKTIKKNGFNYSQIEIDDNWETCYGDAKWNPDRFPDPAKLVHDLHVEGFRVTLWIHPFINANCESFAFADEKGYFVKDSDGVTQKTHWWDGLRSGIIDFTNKEAVDWWIKRLVDIQESTGMDSFKFDAGESSWMPHNFTLNVTEELWPNAYTRYYVDAISDFGSLIETRVGRGTQRHPIFVRMLDKDSVWGEENGLRTLVPSLLHSGILGYPYVLPDMIGGNAYTLPPGKELFVRWAQANAFMPALQFSILPWSFDDEVVKLCKAATSLHTTVMNLMTVLAQEAIDFGAPILRPTWWMCPEDENCLTADQQFLVGGTLLSVPIVEKGADSVDVVIPEGDWLLAGSDGKETFTGPTKVTLKNITLSDIVYLIKQPMIN